MGGLNFKKPYRFVDPHLAEWDDKYYCERDGRKLNGFFLIVEPHHRINIARILLAQPAYEIWMGYLCALHLLAVPRPAPAALWCYLHTFFPNNQNAALRLNVGRTKEPKLFAAVDELEKLEQRCSRLSGAGQIAQLILNWVGVTTHLRAVIKDLQAMVFESLGQSTWDSAYNWNAVTRSYEFNTTCQFGRESKDVDAMEKLTDPIPNGVGHSYVRAKAYKAAVKGLTAVGFPMSQIMMGLDSAVLKRTYD